MIPERLRKALGIAIPVAAVVLIIALAVIFRADIFPGWHEKDGVLTYVTFPFVRAKGMADIGGHRYYFSERGGNPLVKGWFKTDGYYYYADESGRLVTGERIIGGENWSFEADYRNYRNEAVIVGGRLWYFDSHGYKVFGIVELNGEKFCFSENGNLSHGLQNLDGKYYYFDPENENMVYGLKTVGGAVYYFGEDGAAYTGTHVIDGVEYTFAEDGKRIN
ncbi:MAG: hypothetical protein J6Z80_00795 [Clostridia bacterium]|nr:hypothetical protein [Clostridia bacterium]